MAGLVSAKVLRGDGFDVTLFEKEATIGGVWAPSRTYPGLRANNPRESYAFSDHPYDRTVDDFPRAEQIRDYLASYVERFRLGDALRLSAEVISVSCAPSPQPSHGGFDVLVRRRNHDDATERLHFDFVVVCNGVFSEPNVPSIEGVELFAGTVLHSSQIVDPEVVRDKHVVIVGAGKSALDCANFAAERGRSATLVLRAPHWIVPRYMFGKVRIDHMVMTRFSELFLRYHRRSGFERFLHGPANAVVRLWWRGLNLLMPRLVGMPPELVPEARLPFGFENAGIGGEFFATLRQGRVVAKRAQLKAFRGPTQIELDSGERIDADVVIFATGWRQGVHFLDVGLRQQIQKQGEFHFYRSILPPTQPRLGFIGYASSTACQFTSEIGAHWLSQCFRGELSLPTVAEMNGEIERVRCWMAETFPARDQGYFIGPYIAHYADELMRDMGMPVRRTSNVFREYFAPFWPSRYATLGEERRRVPERSAPAAV